MYPKKCEVSVLEGQTLIRITPHGNQEIFFETADKKYRMYHQDDCCERVEIEDVCGDWNDLIGSPILKAEEVTSHENPPGVPIPEYQDSFTWTFYTFSTIKGTVTLRWYGESNGYYSESVDFYQTFPLSETR